MAEAKVIPLHGDGDARRPKPGKSQLQGGLALVGMIAEGADRLAASSPELERSLAHLVAFLRRRITGDYEVDEFGFDRDLTENLVLPIMRPLYDKWFRIEVQGVENLPSTGSGLVVANHSGTIPVDGMMLQYAIHHEHPQQRFVRLLGADLVFDLPLIGQLARKTGGTLAGNVDAERLLTEGELVGVFPEGFKGVGKGWSQRYRLQRFGRGGFVATAMRTGAPIIPTSIVGAEEIYPMIADLKPLARALGFPYFPITPYFPLLGLAGVIPLPSKWIIEFGEPIETAHFGPEAADDPMEVFELTDRVREQIQQTLYALLLQRGKVFRR